jgi:hypothetical protein
MKKVTINYKVEGKKVTALIIESFNISYLEDKYGLRLNDSMFIDLRHKYLENLYDKDGNIFVNNRMIFEGVAKCSDNDTFSESIGKKIARDRVMIKYLSYVRYLLKLKENVSGIGTIEQSIRSYKGQYKIYTFYFWTGKFKELKGESPFDALLKAGYSKESLSTISFYEEGKYNNNYEYDNIKKIWINILDKNAKELHEDIQKM